MTYKPYKNIAYRERYYRQLFLDYFPHYAHIYKPLLDYLKGDGEGVRKKKKKRSSIKPNPIGVRAGKY